PRANPKRARGDARRWRPASVSLERFCEFRGPVDVELGERAELRVARPPLRLSGPQLLDLDDFADPVFAVIPLEDCAWSRIRKFAPVGAAHTLAPFESASRIEELRLIQFEQWSGESERSERALRWLGPRAVPDARELAWLLAGEEYTAIAVRHLGIRDHAKIHPEESDALIPEAHVALGTRGERVRGSPRGL